MRDVRKFGFEGFSRKGLRPCSEFCSQLLCRSRRRWVPRIQISVGSLISFFTFAGAVQRRAHGATAIYASDD